MERHGFHPRRHADRRSTGRCSEPCPTRSRVSHHVDTDGGGKHHLPLAGLQSFTRSAVHHPSRAQASFTNPRFSHQGIQKRTGTKKEWCLAYLKDDEVDCPGSDVRVFGSLGICNHPRPYCPDCKRSCREIPEVVFFAKEEETTPEQWVKSEEETYNPTNEHFLCDTCFIAREESSGRRLVGPGGTRWVCP